MAQYVEVDDATEPVAILARTMPREAISVNRFVRQVLLDPNFRREGSILAVEDGAPVAYGLAVARQVLVEGAMPDADRGYLWLMGVLPEARRRGIGSAILARLEEFLRGQGRRTVLAGPYSPGYFQPGVDVDAYPEGLRFLAHHGYTEVYRPLAMEAPLWNLEIPDWMESKSPGVRLSHDPVPILPKLLAFARDEFGPEWARYVRDSVARQLDGDRRTGITTALEGDEVLGFGHFDAERFGPIGVAEKERGRAIGHRLMFDVLQRQREAGYRVSWFLWSDDRTKARIYEQAGFREVRRFSLMKKELA